MTAFKNCILFLSHLTDVSDVLVVNNPNITCVSKDMSTKIGQVDVGSYYKELINQIFYFV